MVQSADEYPFWGRWIVDNIVASDITSVNYDITVYNPTTNVFTSLSTGSVGAASADGKWIVPYTIPVATGFKKYVCILTPVGGSHPVLNDEIDTLDGLVTITGSTVGTGTETHSGCAMDPDGTHLEGVTVRAVPVGTTTTWASDITDVNGDYDLVGLVAGHAYIIYYNKPGYWEKRAETVIA